MNREVGPDVHRPIDPNAMWNYDERPMSAPQILTDLGSASAVLEEDDADGGALRQLSTLRFRSNRGFVVHEIDVAHPEVLSTAKPLLTRFARDVSTDDMTLARQEFAEARKAYRALAGRALWNGLEERPDRASGITDPAYLDLLDRQASLLPAGADDFDLSSRCSLFWALRGHFDYYTRSYAEDASRSEPPRSSQRSADKANGPRRGENGLRPAQNGRENGRRR
jgi:hypothetical protein